MSGYAEGNAIIIIYKVALWVFLVVVRVLVKREYMGEIISDYFCLDYYKRGSLNCDKKRLFY